jgi:hypothetical protein
MGSSFSVGSARRWGGWDRWSEQWHVGGHHWRGARHWGCVSRQRWRKRRWCGWHAGEWYRIRWNTGLWHARWYRWYRWHSQHRQRAFAQRWSSRCEVLDHWSEGQVYRWQRGQHVTLTV